MESQLHKTKKIFTFIIFHRAKCTFQHFLEIIKEKYPKIVEKIKNKEEQIDTVQIQCSNNYIKIC